MRNKKISELLTLKQGDSIVIEFEMRFSSLANFSTVQLTDDAFKATIFEVGLRPNIRRAIAHFPLVSYVDVMARSLAIEPKKVVLKKDRDASTPSKSVQTSPSYRTGRDRSIRHILHLIHFRGHHRILRGLHSVVCIN